MSVNKPAILVADGNKNVARFLSREFDGIGFSTFSAAAEADMWALLRAGIKADLVVLDPNLTSLKPGVVLARIRNLLPGVKIIIHDYDPAWAECLGTIGCEAFVEKKGDNLNLLVYSVKWLLGARDGKMAARPDGGSRPSSPEAGLA